MGEGRQHVPKGSAGICQRNLFLALAECRPIANISRHLVFPESRGFSVEMLIQGALGRRLSSAKGCWKCVLGLLLSPEAQASAPRARPSEGKAT